MLSGKRKTGIILILYSFSITLILLFASVIFIKTAAPPRKNTDRGVSYFIINNENIVQSLETGVISVPYNNGKPTILSPTTVEDYYMSRLMRYFLPVMLCLFVLITFLTWFLWKALNRQNEQQNLFIAQDLKLIEASDDIIADSGTDLSDQHPAILKSYLLIREKLDAYVSDFIKLSSYITHEQKNILSLLRAKLQVAGQTELIGEVDKVTASIDDVLTLSATKNMEKDETIDTALICADACDDYKKIYSRISFIFDDEANNNIHARRTWVYRSVCNLIDNAVKYGNGSEIEVAVKNKKGSVIISVTDHGPGIEPEYQKKLFDNRFRISSLKKNGYGIGLNLVKHVCELCGGLVWVDSSIGKGSTFYMVFREA